MAGMRQALGFLVRALGPASVLFLAACGGDKQAHVQSPPHPVQAGTTNMQAPAGPVNPPNTPTASNVAISEEVVKACGIPDGDAYFPFDSSHLTESDFAPLDAVAKCFTSGPLQGRKMRLVGHADPRGLMDYNLTLGQSRADSVALYLVARGLNPLQATSTSRGAMDATGTDEATWAQDRRVDVLLGN
ncbi:MAG TPA: OmpA family protein [Polyangiaceae bacterium]|nr:OmpA family protein [Polyangiaceae bacterium]